MKCILCKTEYENKVVDLGEIYQSGFIDKPEDEKLHKKSELGLGKCVNCGFVQLTKTLPPDTMYREYWYRSGLNSTMVSALKDIVESTTKRHATNWNYWGHNKRVLDIGCNDGTLLSMYDPETFKVGFDPANNLAPYATKYADVFVNNYFSKDTYFKKKFDIITSIAMFYDLEDPDSFIEAIKQNLDDKGIWVIQMTDLGCTLSINAFDNICHEHLAYYQLKELKKLLNKHDLDIFDVSYNDVNGRSVRVYISHSKAYYIDNSVFSSLLKEEKYINENWSVKFNSDINKIGECVKSVIKEANNNNKKVYALGASTKGNTLLQVFNIDNSIVPKAMEVSSAKFGKYTLGSNLKIVSEAEGFKDKPDYLLILPWHFTEFFIKQHKNYLNSGGKFIVPMPEPAIISRQNGVTNFIYLDRTITTW